MLESCRLGDHSTSHHKQRNDTVRSTTSEALSNDLYVRYPSRFAWRYHVFHAVILLAHRIRFQHNSMIVIFFPSFLRTITIATNNLLCVCFHLSLLRSMIMWNKILVSLIVRDCDGIDYCYHRSFLTSFYHCTDYPLDGVSTHVTTKGYASVDSVVSLDQTR